MGETPKSGCDFTLPLLARRAAAEPCAQRRLMRSHALRCSNAPLLYGSKPFFGVLALDAPARGVEGAMIPTGFELAGAAWRAGSSSSSTALRRPNHLPNHMFHFPKSNRNQWDLCTYESGDYL
jgi:hypothetical protein